MFLVPGSSPSTLSAVIHIDIQDRRLPEASDASYRLSSLSEKESKASWGKMQRLQSQLYCPTLDKTLTVPSLGFLNCHLGNTIWILFCEFT